MNHSEMTHQENLFVSALFPYHTQCGRHHRNQPGLESRCNKVCSRNLSPPRLCQF